MTEHRRERGRYTFFLIYYIKVKIKYSCFSSSLYYLHFTLFWTLLLCFVLSSFGFLFHPWLFLSSLKLFSFSEEASTMADITHPPMEQLQDLEYCIDSNPPWGTLFFFLSHLSFFLCSFSTFYNLHSCTTQHKGLWLSLFFQTYFFTPHFTFFILIFSF